MKIRLREQTEYTNPIQDKLHIVAAVILGLGLLALVNYNLHSASQNADVYAADAPQVPTGIAGVVRSMQDMPRRGTVIKRVGTSAETVIVGQRVQTVGTDVPRVDISKSIESGVEGLSQRASSLSSRAAIMTDADYQTLLKIVEAEAGTEDVKGRVLVANVIMNRVKDDEFPSTVTDVVYQYENGVAQFSPVADGRIYDVTISKETMEAVQKVLEGEDYSKGALFFIQKDAADKGSLQWFEKNLKFLLKYGVHEFFTYP